MNKKYKKGFELLHLRNDNSFLGRLESFEAKNNLYFPPIFKLILSTFQLENLIIREEILMPDESLTDFSYIGFSQSISFDIKNDGYFLSEFFDLYLILNYSIDDHNWIEDKRIPIADTTHGGAYYIGTIGGEVDKIFVQDIRGKVHCIANNIIDFINGLGLVRYDEFLSEEGFFFYKNFGENFWRIKDR